MKWHNKTLPAILLSCLFLLILAQPACARVLLGVSLSQENRQKSANHLDLDKQIDRAFGDQVVVHNYTNQTTLLSMLMQFNKVDAALISQKTYDQQPKGKLIALATLQISNESEQAQMVLAARENLASGLREQLVQGYQELLLSTNGLDLLEQYATSTEAPISELISKQSPDSKKAKPEGSTSKPVVAKSIFSSIGGWFSPSKTTQIPDAELPAQTKQASGTQAILSAGASPPAAPKTSTPEITETDTNPGDSEKSIEKASKEVETLTAASFPEKKQEKLWGPHLDIISKLGNERVLGEASLFMPMLQGPDRMLFTDLRFQIDDNDAQEGNLGLGYRQIIKDLILGGYIYHDKRETRHNNSFRQWTFGLEALSVNYDTRFNVYLADEDTEEIDGIPGATGLAYSGNNLLYKNSFEKSLSGFDFELGGLIPTPYHPELRAYLGGYHFSASGVDDITGPKARLAVRFPDMFDWDKSFFELGGEISNDEARGTDYYVTGRLHIPFGKKLVSQPKPTMTTLEGRMTERVVRDPDIVTVRENKTTPLTFNSEALEFTHINSAGAGGQGTFESPYGTLTEVAGAPAETILMHADSVFNNENLSLSANQRLLGDFDGARHLIETDQMGTVLLPRFSTGLSAPVIQNAPNYAVRSADNTEISGLTALNSDTGILVNALGGQVDIRNVALVGNNRGVDINNSAGTINIEAASVADSTSSNLSVTGGSAAVNVANNSSLTQNSTGALVAVAGGHTGTIDFSADTTSTANSGAGFQFDNADGSYSFRNAISLDGTSNGIDIANGTDGDIEFYGSVEINNPQGAGITVTNSTGNANFFGPTTISTTSGDGVNINASSGSYTFNGLDITAQNGSGLIANTVGLVSVTGTGNTVNATGGKALDIDNATIDMTFDSLASADSTNEGVLLNYVTGTGASNGLQVTGSTAVTNSGTTGVSIQGSSADIALGNLTVTTAGVDGLALNFIQTGNFTAGTTTISNTAGNGISVTNHQGNATFGDTAVTNTGTDGILIDNNAAGSNLVFNSANINNTARGLAVSNNAGTLAINGGAIGAATPTTAESVLIDGGNGNLNIATDIVNTTANSVAISNRTGGTVTLSGNINDTDFGINASNNTGGAINFSGADKTLNTGANDAVTLTNNTGATINFTNGGLVVDTSSAKGFNVTGGGAINVTGTGNTVNATGGAALDIDNATIDMTFDSLASTNSASEGLLLNNITGAGTSNGLQVTGSTSVTNSGTTGVSIQGSSADIALGDLTVATAGTDGLALNFNQTGNFTAGTTTISGTTGNGIYVTNHQGNATFGDTMVTNAGADGILIDNNAAGSNLVFNSANINNTARGLAVSNNAGTLAINGGAIGAATPTTAESVLIDGGNGNLNIATDIVNTTANSVAISNRTGGTVTLSGNINDTDLGINASNNTGGAINFSGSDKTLNTGANDAVTLTNNTGAAINFTNGGLAINTTGGSGFSVTNGGTINVSGTGNSITTDTGSALTLSSTTIGTDGIAFEAIATGTVSGVSAIDIDSVNGGLLYGGDITVAGTNLADAISVTNSAATFAINSLDLDNIDGTGIYLGNSGSVSINSGTIYNTAGSGIEAINTSFDIDNVTIDSTGPGGAGVSIVANDANSALNFTISNSAIINTDLSGLQVNASNSAQIDTMEITGTSFIDNEFHAIDVLANGGASINNLVIGDPNELNPGDVTIRNNGTEAIFIVAGDSSTSTGNTGSIDAKINAIDIIDINNNSSDTNINVEAQGNGSVTFSLSRSRLDKTVTAFSIDNILLVTKQFAATDVPTIDAYITDNDLKNGTIAGLTARNSSTAGSLSLYLLNNETNNGSTIPSYGFTLDKQSTGLMELYSRDDITNNNPTFVQLEDLLRDQGNTDGTIGILNPAGDTSTIIIAPLP